jgi:hypothetical protein
LRINLFENENLAKVHHPEFKLVTNDIEEVYKRLLSSHLQFLHPNLREVTLRPWGCKRICVNEQTTWYYYLAMVKYSTNSK